MLNLLPWRSELELTQRKNLIILIVLSSLIIQTCTLNFRWWLSKKVDVLKKDEISSTLHLHQEEAKKLGLVKKMKLLGKVYTFLNESKLQKKYVSVLENLAYYLPENSYLTYLSWSQNELKLEGVLLTSAPDILQKFVNLFKKINQLKLIRSHAEMLDLVQQRFQLVFFVMPPQ